MTGLFLTPNELRGTEKAKPFSLKSMIEGVAGWRREAKTVRELSKLSDRQLEDLGYTRRTLRDSVHQRMTGR